MILQFHKSFDRSYQKLDEKLQAQTKERLRLFLLNPFAVQLNNHALKGKYLGYRSINITGDYRAIFKVTTDAYIFGIIDTHGNLY